jgi:hypothetical protein
VHVALGTNPKTTIFNASVVKIQTA